MDFPAEGNPGASGELAIRPATVHDLAAILHHRHAMFEAMGFGDPNALDAMLNASKPFFGAALADGSYRGWLAETAEGRVIAGGGVGVTEWPPSPRDSRPYRATIFNVYTEPEFRRRGIARRLMQEMIEWCRKQGFVVVNLHASDDGRALYEALGFVPTNEMRLTFEDSQP